MPYLLNLIYLLVLLLLAPWLVYKAFATGKYRRGFGAKSLGRVSVQPRRADAATLANEMVVWFHGVSVGEIHLLRQVVAKYRERHPGHHIVISTTTDTGHDEARKCFPDLQVTYWPFDFSWAVDAALKRVRPDLVVFAESEIWPNFVWAAKRRGVKLAIINGRMSPRSAARFHQLSWLARRLFAQFDVIAAQTEEYAAGYRELGAGNVVVTGSVKYDGAPGDRRNPKTTALRELFAIGPDELVWVAGSTQAPEEEIALGIYRGARERHPNLRLILVPRQKDRFDAVAGLLERSGLPWIRRSALGPARFCEPGLNGANDSAASRPIILVDTIGELGAVWGLADIAFVGGSLDGVRGGQNMIEPSAYGAAVLFGPHTWNFKDTVARLKERRAAIEAADAAALENDVVRLLDNVELRMELGRAARQFVLSQQGATAKTLDVLDATMPRRESPSHGTSIRMAG
ncbi:MAG: 3-deoxy-D-manno-octulosonic acid transferase [Gemmataceae bacterium]|nr:3-deoxy-D-manno-octulosonic acid transferase [Gemmataceae bacterium]